MIFNRLFIPFTNHFHIGGPATFMANLQRYLDDKEFPYTTHRIFSKGIFFKISYDLKILDTFKRRNLPIIQRLDGIYYPSQHGDGYKLLNKDIKTIYNNYATHVVFQSQYSRRQCFAMMGEKLEREYTIIHNGADKNIYYPAKEALPTDGKVRFIMTGSFRKKAMIEPVVLALDELKGSFDFELIVVGPVIEKEIEPFFKRDYITMAGSKDNRGVAEMLRSAHIFIHSQLNDNCPNAVLEALSCGLPVVGFDSGAMSELLCFNTELLAPVSDEVFQKYEDFDWRKLKEKIELVVGQYPKHKQLAMEHHQLYSFEECGKKYVEVFNKTCEL